MTITRDDWLKAIDEARFAPLPESDALSITELAELFGVKRMAATVRAQDLVACGKAELTTKQIRTRQGMVRTVTAYRLMKPTGTRTARRRGAK